jgi:two-component system LytT family response regulator
MIKNKLSLKVGRETIFVEQQNIICIKAENIYVRIFLRDGSEVLATHKLYEMFTLLNTGPFFKVHRSYIVNLNYINKYVKALGSIFLTGYNEPIPISRNLKNQLESKILM